MKPVTPLSHRRWPQGLATALLAASAFGLSAQAADPIVGAQRYKQSCAECHGTSPLTSNRDKIYYGRNSASTIDSSISSVGDMKSLRSAFPAGSAQIADIAAYLGNSPASLSFASTNVGATSATQSVTVAASLKSGKSITNLVISTTGDFRRSGGTCGTTVNTGTTCTVLVAFAPTAGGTRTGTLKIAHSQLPTPATIQLSGTGAATAAPAAAVSPTALAFASTPVGVTSAAKSTTLTNTGNAKLTLGTISSSSTQFIVSGGTCVAGSSLAAGAACTVAMKFKPTSTGARSGTLNIAHDAKGSLSKVSLSGTATAAAPLASFSPASLAFANQVVNTASATKTIKLTNTGSASLKLGTITIKPSHFKISGGTCVANASVAAGATCTVTVKFKPTTTGTKSGTLTVLHNATGSPTTVALSGKGVAGVADITEPLAAGSAPSSSRSQALAFDASAGPVLALDQSTLAFGAPEQTLTLSNRGSTALRLEGLQVAGDAAGDFMLSGACTGIDLLAPGDHCALVIGFAPGAAGERSATLNITSNALNGAAAISLNGGAALADPKTTSSVGPEITAGARAKGTPVLAWLNLPAKGLDFGPVATGQRAAGTTLWLHNRGPGAATLGPFELQGDEADEFALQPGGSCVAGASLPSGASCSLVVGFSPAAAGARRATLEVQASSASLALEGNSASLALVNLAGQGSAVAGPALRMTPASLSLVGSEPQTVMLHNEGSAVLQVQRVAVSRGDFSVAPAGSEGCDGDSFALMPGQRCAVQVSRSGALKADEGSDRTGTLEVSSDASASSVQVALSAASTEDPAQTLPQDVPALEGGGCSLARGDTAADPVLWLLVLGAAGVLWRRRRNG
jgi:Abnormal spindle-like microcephaly-assoc'd, ASPM-SPD-2-Hydin